MWQANEKVIAIFLSDIHLSLKPPIWRSAEPDWFEAMKRPLLEIANLQQINDCPVICAGDIFDRWNCSPELINFALEYLPNSMYCIAGQHDLPLHNYEDIKKSAYWTLVESRKVQNIVPNNNLIISNSTSKFLVLYGFPFGCEIKPLSDTDNQFQNKHSSNWLAIAIVHEYICIEGKDYINAPKESYLERRRTKFIDEKIMGYDIIIYGDNHKGFLTRHSQKHHTQIFNCGTLMRRKSDEINYKPQIGLLFESGKAVPHYLDISKDKYLESISEADENKKIFDMSEFIKELDQLGTTALDFVETLKQVMKDKNSDTKKIILEAMEK